MSTQRMNELLEMHNEEAPIARTLGMRLSYTDEGNAVIDLPYNPNLDHGQGGIHGGIYATVLDTAAWFTAAAAHDESSWVATSELTIHLLKPAKETALRAVGQVIKNGKRQDIVEAHLYDEGGQLVGHAVGTFIVLPSIPMQ